MGVKNYILKKYMKSKMKNVPQQQQDMIMKLIDEKPELFEKMGKEIKQKTKEGKSETAASMEVMRKYQNELRELMM